MTRPTFAPWWQPWRWCWARRAGCRLPRHHYTRHGYPTGWSVKFFDTAKEGTP